MLRVVRPKLYPYTIAVLTCAIALLLTWLLEPLMSPTFFALFYPAVMVSSFYGGLRAGLLCITLSAVATKYLFLPPVYSLAFTSPNTLFRFTVLILVALMIGLLSAALRTAQERTQVSLQQLQASEVKFRRLVESNIIGVISADTQGAITEANDAFLQMMGYTREDLLAGRVRWDDMTPPDLRHLDVPALEELRTRGAHTPYEKAYISKEGHRVPILVGSALLDDESRENVISFILNLSDRKRAEEKLAQSQQLFVSFMNHSPARAYIKDETGRYIYVNSKIEHDFNRKLADWVGKRDFDFMPTEIAQQWRDNDLTVLAANQPVESVEIIPHEDGEHYWMAFKFPFQDSSGRRFVAGMSIDITDRKRAEEALRENEQRLKLALETAKLGSWQLDFKTGDLSCSDQCKANLGLSPEAVFSHQQFLEAIHPDDRTHVQEAAERAIASSTDYEAEYRTIWPDGSIHWIVARGRCLYAADGIPLRLVGVCLDITKPKQAELALRASENLYRTLSEAVPDFIWSCDAEGRTDFVNSRWLEYAGMTIEELNAGGLEQVYHPEDFPWVIQHWNRARQHGEAFEVECRFRHKDGLYRWFMVRAVPLKDGDGNIIKWIGTTTDIHKRKQAELELQKVEQALRESESLFRRMADGAPMFIWMSGLDGHCTYFNQLWLDFVGQSLEEALTIGWPEGIHPDDKEYCLQTYLSAFNARDRFQIEYRHRRKDGEYRWLLDEGVPLFNEDGSFAGYIGSGIDISDRKRTEQAQQYLAEASRVLSSSLDYQTTLRSIAQLTVPHLADWCTVHLIEEDGSVQPLATAHTNPAKIRWANQMNQKYPVDLNAPRGIAQVLRTGKSELYPDIPDHLLVEAAHDAEHLQILRKVGFKSVMMVPVSTGGRTLGTISFISAESGRCYDSADLSLAEELARRAALAVENARLYQQAQQARQRAEQAAECTARLQAVTAAFSEALTPAQVAEVVVNQGIFALGVRSGFIALLSDDKTSLEIVESVGLPQSLIDTWRHFSITASVPIAETVRTGEPIFIESAQEFVTKYSILAHAPANTGNRAFAYIPLTVEGRILGGMSFSFAEAKKFSEDDRSFILTLAHLCSQAIARARLYEAEQRARREAEAANRIKDEFLAVLSHELRSPLNPILGWTSLLRSRKFDEKATDRALETIERNAKLQTQLIEDLLDVSRILRGKLVLNVAPVNLVTTIEAAMETVRLAAQSKEIQIQTVFEPNVGPVAGDSNRLQQVVWNLLSNAIKFTPPKGQVEVRVEKVEEGLQVSRLQVEGSNSNIQHSNVQPPDIQHSNVQPPDIQHSNIQPSNIQPSNIQHSNIQHSNIQHSNIQPSNIQPSNIQPSNIQPPDIQPSTQYAQIQVKDTGKGISPEFLPHVFEHFRQENSSTTRKYGGLGLGLAIVRYLTELHGGSVQAESPGEGLGATFTVRLPLMVAVEETTQAPAQPNSSADLYGLRILVVDDEEDIRELVAFVLEQSGAEVTVAASADEALVALNQSVPDVLLSDIGMPEVDGYMLMRQVRALLAEGDAQELAMPLAIASEQGEAQQHKMRMRAIALTAYAGEYDQHKALQAGFQLHLAKPVEPEVLVRAIAHLVGRV
jgi:PAS domain S-box-containing protein